MASNSSGNVTINPEYLKSLSKQLQTLLDGVNQVNRIMPQAAVATSAGNIWDNLQVQAGGGTPKSQQPTFDAASQLNMALSGAGSTIGDELTWLQNVLTDMISEIQTTVQGMQSTDSLNAESAQTLMQDFQNTMSDIQASPVPSGSGGSSGTGSSGSTGSGGTGSGSTGSGGGSSSTSSSNG